MSLSGYPVHRIFYREIFFTSEGGEKFIPFMPACYLHFP